MYLICVCEKVFMNILFLCNTYYQLIIAMQLKMTQFAQDEVYLILSDHSRNSKVVVNNLKTTEIFKDVYHIETQELDYTGLEKKNLLFSIPPIILGNSKRFDLVSNLKIDKLVYYNFFVSVQQLFSVLYKSNHKLQCARMEEGILAYQMHYNDNKYHWGRKLSSVIYSSRKLLGEKNLYECVNDFYCFQPDFYNGILNPVKIEPVSSDGQLKDFLVKAFDIRLSENDYKEKYIFFTSVYDFEGGEPIGEYELVCKIVDLVGKENLLIKTHPRDTRTIYEDKGFTVDKNSSVPWEAIQLSRDFSDKVFLTVNSGSVLAGSFMSDNPPKTFFMHRCCNIDDNVSAKTAVDTIEKLLSEESLKPSLKTVAIANDVKDILI